MTRNEYIAETAARHTAAGTFFADALHNARELADALEDEGVAPWVTDARPLNNPQCIPTTWITAPLTPQCTCPNMTTAGCPVHGVMR